MHKTFLRLGFRAATAAMTLALFTAGASAQARLNAEQLKLDLDGKPWITGFVSVLLLAIVGVAAFLKSKRGHQD